MSPLGGFRSKTTFPALTGWANEFRRLRRLVVEANA